MHTGTAANRSNGSCERKLRNDASSSWSRPGRWRAPPRSPSADRRAVRNAGRAPVLDAQSTRRPPRHQPAGNDPDLTQHDAQASLPRCRVQAHGLFDGVQETRNASLMPPVASTVGGR